ncbi:RelB [Lactobacillus sp. ESL0791]|uniref:type II toxin-antitoxin system RelB/DinJ family antitoxin n=1 Tax=Lactobacillus sp. ESL0791 TaxID=2983234 RepID=UPI0023F6B4F7|nr:type II toxin-antitoxin system RelB/DinJ family antitoxin [Lactobacillus sp. ESL0791]MDF7638253.1 RelB [Lactobacillus sp. ESL0791]
MRDTTTKNVIVSTRITKEIAKKAKKNLAAKGITRSEYIRLALVKAANNEVQLINFLGTPEALQAKKEVETGQVTTVDSLKDFNKWADGLGED